MIRIDLEFDDLEDAVEAADEALERAPAAALEAAAREVVQRSRASTAYRDRTGTLDQSTDVERVEVTADGAEATVAATAPYAGFVERGTSKMAPRRFLEGALDETRPEEHVAAEVIAGLQKAGF